MAGHVHAMLPKSAAESKGDLRKVRNAIRVRERVQTRRAIGRCHGGEEDDVSLGERRLIKKSYDGSDDRF